MPLLVEKPESLRPLFYPSKENLGTTQDLAGRKFALNSAQKDKVLNYFLCRIGRSQPSRTGMLLLYLSKTSGGQLAN